MVEQIPVISHADLRNADWLRLRREKDSLNKRRKPPREELAFPKEADEGLTEGEKSHLDLRA